MSTLTKNFNLVKPDGTDAADITSTNGNLDKIDTELSKSRISSYTDLTQFGLSDSEMSPTDFASNIDKIIMILDDNAATLMLIVQNDVNPNLHASLVQKLNNDTDLTFSTESHAGWLYIRFSGEAYRPVLIETNLETAKYYDRIWSCVYNKGTSSNDMTSFIGCAKTATFNVSIPTSWTTNSSNGGYKQTIAVNGILASDTPIADVVFGDNVETNKKQLQAWGCVDRITTAANSITIYSYNKAPSVAFNIQLKVVR